MCLFPFCDGPLQLCYDSKDDSTIQRGITFVNTTQISVFDNPQRAEWFRLKAKLHDRLGVAYASQAHASLSHAMQVKPTYHKGWLSWGSLLDK